MLDKTDRIARVVLPVVGAATLLPQVSSAVALVAGVVIALSCGNPYLPRTRKLAPKLLQASVIGLGAGMNLITVGRVGLQGIGYTLAGIAFTLVLGMFLARRLKIQGDTGLLVSVGTAICGGSAIAAVVPAIGAKEHEASVALGIVFLLNAAGLVLFPLIGHALQLGQPQFGLWSALAIHDTSSVVGATMQYGSEALAVGTTVKLARALWIVPVTFVVGYLHARRSGRAQGASSSKKPWFILGFLALAALVTYVPALREPGHWIELAARRALVLTLFLIGTGLTRKTLREVGLRPLIHGVVLWAIVASTTLAAILSGLIA